MIMKNLRQLSDKELKTIEGGDWIKELGESTHRAWCKFTSGISKGYRNMMKYSDTNNVG